MAHQAGGPGNPLGLAAISTKFRENASLALDTRATTELEQAILGIDDSLDVSLVFGELASIGEVQT